VKRSAKKSNQVEGSTREEDEGSCAEQQACLTAIATGLSGIFRLMSSHGIDLGDIIPKDIDIAC